MIILKYYLLILSIKYIYAQGVGKLLNQKEEENNMAIFKKTYTIDVEIDLDKCSNDAEWAVEDWEIDNLGNLLWKLQEDIENFIDKDKEN